MIFFFTPITKREVKKAKTYITTANRYNERKPKNMELYSKNPPNIAPIKLDAKITLIGMSRFTSVEKTIPEKNNGTVSNPVKIILVSISGTSVKDIKVTTYPKNNVAINRL